MKQALDVHVKTTPIGTVCVFWRIFFGLEQFCHLNSCKFWKTYLVLQDIANFNCLHSTFNFDHTRH